MTNKEKLQQWVDDWGEDSDYVRVRVRGVFPRKGSNQFIGSDVMEFCRTYEAGDVSAWPLIISCDVARFGDDETVMMARQHRRVYEHQAFRGLSVVEVANHLCAMADHYKEKTGKRPKLFIDDVGVGGGVVDICVTRGYDVVPVNAGAAANDSEKYYNKRAEMYGEARDFLKDGVQFDTWNNALEDQLTAIEYRITNKQQLALEKKDDMKARGLSSPDHADCFVMGFATRISVDGDVQIIRSKGGSLKTGVRKVKRR